jgi:hypothetical protein
MMNSKDCWVLHPLNKPQEYIQILPQIIESVRTGNVPEEQLGYENINLEAWINYLDKK